MQVGLLRANRAASPAALDGCEEMATPQEEDGSPPTTAVSDDCTSALPRMIISPLETDPGQARSTKLAHRNMEPHLRRDGGS